MVNFYNQAKGPQQWTTKTGWGTATDPCTWFGITCTDGKVVAINLPNNNLGGTISSSLGNTLTSLTSLDLHNNEIAGFFTSSLTSLVNLTYLDLSNNSIGGQLPFANVGKMEAMLHFDVSYNEFDGPLPQFSGSANPPTIGMSDLEYLDVSHNKLTGGFSTQWDLYKLKHADYSYNRLSGSPYTSQMQNMLALEYLDLSHNLLSGAFDFYATLDTLVHVDLSSNSFTGELPIGPSSQRPDLSDLTNLTFYDIRNNGFNGNVTGAFDTAPTSLTTIRMCGNDGLFASTGVTAWLNARDPNWSSTVTC